MVLALLSGVAACTTASPSANADATTAELSSSSSAATVGPDATDASTAAADTTVSPEDSAAESESGAAPDVGVAGDCDARVHPGLPGDTDGLASSGLGVSYNVRTPADYEPTVAHPLIVVFAPGGSSAEASEQFTGLTADATAAGFVVAYADSYIPSMRSSIGQMADIALDISNTWCIDTTRIHYTGDSGGGTTTARVGAYDAGTLPVASIAPVAGGVQDDELAALRCPSPRSVAVHHTTGDAVFPIASGHGEAVALWFAGCFTCGEQPQQDGACRWWPGCAQDVSVGYCEREGPHGLWPDNLELIDFFTGAAP